jgi:integrase
MATTLNALRAFFQWLAGQPGFRSRLTYADADYFQLPEKEARASRASTERYTPSVEQIRHVVALMPHGTDIEKRDRALVAFTLLTGTRDGATASLRIKHLDLEAGRVDHDAREVRTKFSKSYPTYFFPVGNDLRQMVHDWVRHLKENLLFGPDDPLFPATKIGLDNDGLYSRQGLARAGWTTATPIRRVFAAAFAAAGLPYANPHSFRRTLARLGEECCRTPEEFKAWSQNLGHEHVLTTFISYGSVSRTRQADIMKHLGYRPADRMSITSEIVRLAQQLGGGVHATEG